MSHWIGFQLTQIRTYSCLTPFFHIWFSFLIEDPDSFLKSARLQRLPSSSSEMGSQDVSPLRETSKDPFSGDCSCRQDGLTVIITACLTFATGVTVALIMQIYFGDPQVRRGTGLFFFLWEGDCAENLSCIYNNDF